MTVRIFGSYRSIIEAAMLISLMKIVITSSID